MNEQSTARYKLSAVAWLLAAICVALAAPRFPEVLRHFAMPAAVTQDAVPWRTFFVLSETTSVAVIILCIHSLWLSQHEKRLQLAWFFLNSQNACLVLGGIALALTAVSYMVKQGVDTRHIYVLGIAALGIAAMVVIAAVAFAFLLGPSKSSSTISQKHTNPSWQIALCLLHTVGAATATLLVVIPFSWLLFYLPGLLTR